jgi:hypothetical protein
MDLEIVYKDLFNIHCPLLERWNLFDDTEMMLSFGDER